MNKIKNWFSNNWTATKVVWKNFTEFVDAACLATVSGFSIFESLNNKSLHKLWAYALLVAGLVIALQAFVLLVKHFNKPAGK